MGCAWDVSALCLWQCYSSVSKTRELEKQFKKLENPKRLWQGMEEGLECEWTLCELLRELTREMLEKSGIYILLQLS